MATVPCPVCGKRVAVGAFCVRCGAHLSPQRGNWAESLRISAYAAAPGEHVLRLSVVSSLFPRLPRRCVSAFRVGLAALLAVLVVCALLRWQPPLIALSTVGLPLAFLTYLRLSDVYNDVPIRTLAVTALLAVGLALLSSAGCDKLLPRPHQRKPLEPALAKHACIRPVAFGTGLCKETHTIDEGQKRRPCVDTVAIAVEYLVVQFY